MTAEAEQLQHGLLTAQNSDGGWAYQQGSSWTEPTALALLALTAQSNTGPAYNRGAAWLRNRQRSDGGWAPHPGIDTSTSVTSLAVLALSHNQPRTPAIAPAVRWLLAQENGDVPLLERLAFRVLGAQPPKAPGGSPWFPGTAAWISPTVLSVLALARTADVLSQASPERQRLAAAVRQAQQYILSRKCRDHGWNHGGSSFRSEDAESYPEMTGMALLALQNIPPAELQEPFQRAEAFLSSSQSAEAVSWLQLAFLRHGRDIDVSHRKVVCRNNRDTCLRLIALAGAASDVFAAPAT